MRHKKDGKLGLLLIHFSQRKTILIEDVFKKREKEKKRPQAQLQKKEYRRETDLKFGGGRERSNWRRFRLLMD